MYLRDTIPRRKLVTIHFTLTKMKKCHHDTYHLKWQWFNKEEKKINSHSKLSLVKIGLDIFYPLVLFQIAYVLIFFSNSRKCETLYIIKSHVFLPVIHLHITVTTSMKV